MFELYNDDCLNVLKKMPDNFIDSLVTDPPAGINFLQKDFDSDRGGRDNWIAWLCEIMKECHRVMKPGAHGLVWALPRTSGWTHRALEDAGFEIRDCVYHCFGSGFPKSLDISVAIDKHFGVEREIIGLKPTVIGRKTKNVGCMAGKIQREDGGIEIGQRESFITKPTTEQAVHWDGFGTALKPAVECWYLIRKPLSEKTIAENVLKHGCGGINIKDCKIRHNDSGKTIQQERFPSNFILSHNPDCEELKEKDIDITKNGNVQKDVLLRS